MHIVYIIILLIAIVEACGQFCLKKGAQQKNNYLYCMGIFSYVIITYLLLKTYKYKGVGFSNLLWSALSIILACVSGKIFFGEKINYPACILVLAAVYLINKEDKEEK
jgi:multidrug transporter EmrE-like cation transporter